MLEDHLQKREKFCTSLHPWTTPPSHLTSLLVGNHLYFIAMHVLSLIVIASIFASSLDGIVASANDVPPSEEPSKETGDLISKFPKLVEWFRKHGGTLDDRVVIGYEPGSKIRGTIANADIPAETVIMHIPQSLILAGEDNDWCPSYEAIKHEMSLGNKSKWFEYLDFDDSTGSRLPLQWTRVKNNHGYPLFELQGLIPDGVPHQHIDWFQGEGGCIVGKEMTDLDFQAFKIYLTRSMDLGLVPMYDLMNHHNGLINTYLRVDDEGGVSVISLLDIHAGFPIYNTYGRSGTQATNDLFTTYGFVEDYPQLWKFTDMEIDESDPPYDQSKLMSIEESEHPHVGYWRMLNFEPNSHLYEVLVISPNLAALLPSKHLTGILGNGQMSLEQWEIEISNHHASLTSTYIDAFFDFAEKSLDTMPTTISQDIEIILYEKRRFGLGYGDTNDSDALMAIEFRLAYKKALRLAMSFASQLKGVGDEL